MLHWLVFRYDETVASFANAAGVGLGGDTLIGGAEGAPQVCVCVCVCVCTCSWQQNVTWMSCVLSNPIIDVHANENDLRASGTRTHTRTHARTHTHAHTHAHKYTHTDTHTHAHTHTQVPVGGNVGDGAGCTALAFRTGAGVPLMAAAGGAG